MTSQKTGGKRTLWVTDAQDPLYKQRADLLLRIGLEIFFVKDVSEFLNGCQQGRPGTIIVDTLPHSDETIQIINLIAKTPELSAARCVLNLTRPAPSACKASMSAHFREVIPWSIDSTIWVQRLSQAVSAKSVEGPIEACSVTMNHPAVLRVSARVIWMNETHVRLESRGAYRLGSTMHVTGPVAAAMGAQHISLVVESIHKNRLVYRYSQAIIAKWGVPIDLLERARALVRRLKADSTPPRVRVFLGMNRVAWRKLAVDALNTIHYEVNVAMQRSNMSDEFAYFSPDIVFFDDRVANNLNEEELVAMFSKLPLDVPLVVFGPDFKFARMKDLMPGRAIYAENDLTSEALANPTKRYKIMQHELDAISALSSESQTIHFKSDHPLSKAELEVSARIRSLNPKGGVIGLPFSLGSFTLARLESPLIKRALGRDVYLKIMNAGISTTSAKNPQYSHESGFRLIDVDQEDSVRIASVIIRTATDYYARQYGTMPKLGIDLKPPVEFPIADQTLSLPTFTPSSDDQVRSADNLERHGEPETKGDHDADYELEPESEHDVKHEANRDDWAPKSVDPLRFRRSNTAPSAIDPVVAKAIGLLLIAALLMCFVIYAATHVDENSYKDHGKEYGEFFKRMKDPDYRKSNPAVRRDKTGDNDGNLRPKGSDKLPVREPAREAERTNSLDSNAIDSGGIEGPAN